ncbi:hypothetical protein [Agrococcus sp. SGAir0287]|uniref:hypothetical protein n=1 Tax=Agrococcus sp. SGAir0287 TaxID=2070347 RepID=UPI0010CD4A71|nr:hypothetical protein [Agrococcus sp. SGAir0287]QCR20451.1 hypothetical protein C1N71_14205 [Agrococcus sp. SGAir0287]
MSTLGDDPDRDPARVRFPPAGIVLLVVTIALVILGTWLAVQGIDSYASQEPERRIAQGELGLALLAAGAATLLATLVVGAMRSIAQQQLDVLLARVVGSGESAD